MSRASGCLPLLGSVVGGAVGTRISLPFCMASSSCTVFSADAKFFILSTPETFHEVSPFLVQKLILSNIGEVKNVKKLRSSDLLLEISNPSQAVTLSKLTTLGSLKVNTSVHRNLNFSRGVISERGLKKHTESELVQELSIQKVCAARRIQIKSDGKLIPTQHIVLTFSTPELPKSIKAGYLNCPIKPYISNPVRCFKCQKFGHSQQACRGANAICAKCSVSGHVSSDCISDDIKCINCGGAHPAFSRSCPRFSWTANNPHVLAVRGDPLDGRYISVPGVSIGRYPSHLVGLLKGIKRRGHSLGLALRVVTVPGGDLERIGSG
ncbi:hypothetical protein AVEN_250895-1 [Araneus ventricosus]|uniref:CCHC-type domain-containing protein n=1 Tax=Araneus ventricosus TaxID=182803 RepID=A0A4Y2S668_ARAVE|nr:hypothetical protein AVEN_250895-1 [Araneus ventricosus]